MTRVGGLILVMEDDENDRFLMRRAFERAATTHPVQFVEDGEQALDYLAGRGPYADRALHPLPVLVLLDLKLPRRPGLDVLAWLRETPGLRRLPVVAMSSTADPAEMGRAYDLGVNSFLVKPLGSDALLALVRAALDWWLIRNESPDLQAKHPATLAIAGVHRDH